MEEVAVNCQLSTDEMSPQLIGGVSQLDRPDFKTRYSVSQVYGVL